VKGAGEWGVQEDVLANEGRNHRRVKNDLDILHNEESHDFCSPPGISKAIASQVWTGP
jgi:hypothetical protein